MIIEFAGLPGSGKSTIIGQLQETLAEEGVSAVRMNSLRTPPSWTRRLPAPVGRVALQLGRAALLVRHAPLVVIVVRALAPSGRPLRDKLLAFRLVTVSLDDVVLARRDGNGTVHLVDEGLVQRCFQLFVDRDGVRRQDLATRLVRMVPPADLLVHVSSPSATALDRIAQRTRQLPIRFAGLSAADVQRRFDEGDALLRTLGVATGAPAVDVEARLVPDLPPSANLPTGLLDEVLTTLGRTRRPTSG